MSLSVEELDQTVKQFYEGRGEVVCSVPALDILLSSLKLTDPTAKASTKHIESSNI